MSVLRILRAYAGGRIAPGRAKVPCRPKIVKNPSKRDTLVLEIGSLGISSSPSLVKELLL